MSTPPRSVQNTPCPAEFAAAVVPSNVTNFEFDCRAIYIGGSGNLTVAMADGSLVTFVGLSAGTILPVRCIRVNSANTTATNIVALY